jgi:hypothetical protein
VSDTIFDDGTLCTLNSPDSYRSLKVTYPTPATTAVQDSSITPVYSLFPNPAKDEVTLVCNVPFCGGCELDIYDAIGQLVKSMSLPNGAYSMDIDTRSFSSGIYVVAIMDGSEMAYKTKLSIIK